MKKLWIIILCVAIAGICLMIGGFLLGADTNISISDEGLKFDRDNDIQIVSRHDLNTISEINVNVASADIEIIPSDEYGFEIRGKSLTYAFENGRLTIEQEHSIFTWRLFGFHTESDSIKIYLPETAFLDSVNLKTSSGRILAETLNADLLSVDVTSGKTALQDLTVANFTAKCTSGSILIEDMTAESADITLTSGDLTVTGFVSNGFTADLTSGNASLSGDFNGENNISITSGNVSMDLKDAKTDYSRFINVTSGSVYIDGQKGGGSDTNTGAENTLFITVTSGNVRLNFGK